MVQRINVLATKPDDLRPTMMVSIPGTHMMESTDSCPLSSNSTSSPWDEHIYKLIHTNK